MTKLEKATANINRTSAIEHAIFTALNHAIDIGYNKPTDIALTIRAMLEQEGLKIVWDKSTKDRSRRDGMNKHELEKLAGRKIEFAKPMPDLTLKKEIKSAVSCAIISWMDHNAYRPIPTAHALRTTRDFLYQFGYDAGTPNAWKQLDQPILDQWLEDGRVKDLEDCAPHAIGKAHPHFIFNSPDAVKDEEERKNHMENHLDG